MYLKTEKPPFYLIGLCVKTSPEHAGTQIPAHWERFYTENCLEKIPNRLNNTLYGVYTDYEGDFTKPYSLIIGTQVSSLSSIPEGMVGKEIPAQVYAEFETEGELPQAIFDKWCEIWEAPLERSYLSDFERYDGGVVSIYIGVK